MVDAIYTAANCKPAYQLRWSLAVFARVELPPVEDWSEALKGVMEQDGVRILECHQSGTNAYQFLLSTRPATTPSWIVQRVKGRLQYLLRERHPKAFRRNFSLTSLGNATRKVVEGYLSEQLGHHRMADPSVDARLASYQLQFPDIDLGQPVFSAHGRYIYNLHVAVVHAERWRQARENFLNATRDRVLLMARQKGHRLSRLAILADHLHLAMGAPHEQSPEDIALGYLNSLSDAHGMQLVYQFGYYVGTFGEYDMNAVRQVAGQS
jgi:REP element-mobilizing transposase RayT